MASLGQAMALQANFDRILEDMDAAGGPEKFNLEMLDATHTVWGTVRDMGHLKGCNCPEDQCQRWPGLATCSLRHPARPTEVELNRRDKQEREMDAARQRQLEAMEIMDGIDIDEATGLNEDDFGFLSDMKSRYATYDTRLRVSVRQLDWLHDIEEKLREMD